jgi:hypothetical protein
MGAIKTLRSAFVRVGPRLNMILIFIKTKRAESAADARRHPQTTTFPSNQINQ